MSTTQASLYASAKEALDKSLPLLDGLCPLNPNADSEEIAAIKAAVKNQLTDLVNELGFVSGPGRTSNRQTRISRTYLAGASIS
jgi:hypothetical protein